MHRSSKSIPMPTRVLQSDNWRCGWRLNFVDERSGRLPFIFKGALSVNYLEQRVDEWRDRGTLREDQQTSQTSQDDDEGQQPHLLSFPQEQPELFEQIHVTSPG